MARRRPTKHRAAALARDERKPPIIATQGGRHTESVMGLINNTDPATVARYQAFASHYVRTGNASEAARLAGYKRKNAKIYGQKVVKEPIVRAFVADMLINLNQEAVIHRNQVVAMLRDIAEDEATKPLERIRALEQMAKISGMIEESKAEIVINSGVMVVPDVKSVEDWQEIAEQSQATLKATVRD